MGVVLVSEYLHSNHGINQPYHIRLIVPKNNVKFYESSLRKSEIINMPCGAYAVVRTSFKGDSDYAEVMLREMTLLNT